MLDHNGEKKNFFGCVTQGQCDHIKASCCLRQSLALITGEDENDRFGNPSGGTSRNPVINLRISRKFALDFPSNSSPEKKT